MATGLGSVTGAGLLSVDNLITALVEGGREPFVWSSIRQ